MNVQNLQLAFSAFQSFVVIPAAVIAVGKYLVRLELRLAKLEWSMNVEKGDDQ